MGTPGGDISLSVNDGRTYISSNAISPIEVTSIGGNSGGGGNGDPGTFGLDKNRGGNGAPGANGGVLDVSTGPTVSGTSYAGSMGEPTSAITIQSLGGAGGAGGIATYSYGGIGSGRAGQGGNGSSISASIGGKWTATSGVGLYVASVGGVGGNGNSASTGYTPGGVNAANGGSGGNINVTISGTVVGKNYGAEILSIGGNGGVGGNGYSTVGGSGGLGGNGGTGGNINLTLAAGATALSTFANGAAIYAASIGGIGGTGGGGSAAGMAGTGNDAGAVSGVINGTVLTSGYGDTYGVLLQSLGGNGGNGGHSGSWFNPISGAGNTGGKANTVTATGAGARIVVGNATLFSDNSSGLVAQSIGGGGGVGPSSSGWFAVGGSGGAASNGNAVNVSLTNATINTFGFNSTGIVAQSIGGGGGKGGDSCVNGGILCNGLIVNLVVGGTAGGGGTAADANAAMLGDSLIQTTNGSSGGISIQSVGGGGGAGGAAYGKTLSGLYGAAISYGGSGGAGGAGGTVNAANTENNEGRILTAGHDSFGLLGQSLGGGGGQGGASVAKAIVKSAKDFPGQSLALSYGGTGGSGGNGSSVYLQNSGFIGTTGGASTGVLAQSIGGGGGAGGDASASAATSKGGINLAVSLAFGGSGSAAGNGGAVQAVNRGLLLTTGESADGVLVQSVGGGGGSGGGGDSKSSSSTDQSLAVGIAMGGQSGGGGSGGNAAVNNSGAIITLGDGAFGIGAQTIGGGGGRAGGGAASNSGTIQLGAQVGGSGGNGGDTYYTGQVNVTNSGTIVTFGADATAILAQSIGGGGGVAGKSGTSLGDVKSTGDGGNGSAASVQTSLAGIAANFAAKGKGAISDYNNLLASISTVNSLLGNSTLLTELASDAAGDQLDGAGASGGQTDDGNSVKTLSLTVAVGGSGGKGGSAGFIDVFNTGDIGTTGKMSDAIVAQSIGGGGGKGGTASTSASTNYVGLLAVGGTGGSGGNGGEPAVTNSGRIYTIAPLSAGIIAQSIGGGGGIGGASATSVTKPSSSVGVGDKTFALAVSLGGNGSKSGIGEGASVTSSGAIETRSHDAIGIIAQSIAGGGGIVKTLATDLDNAGGSASGKSSKDYSINFKFGGFGGAAGNSGAAIVTTAAGGTITTLGDNSYGILAQSIAGGGGLALGGKPVGSSASDFFGSGQMTGSVNIGIDTNPDNNRGVQVRVGDDIRTRGNGAVGVFAQSIGGGGGIAGDTGWSGQLTAMGRGSNHTGNGGDMLVVVSPGKNVITGGANAPAIIAQSIGGGGGWVTNKGGAYVGSAGGTGIGGLITIDVQGVVAASGPASPGIFAQSVGGDSNGGKGDGHTITIIVGSSSNSQAMVLGGNGFGQVAAAIHIDHGSYQGQSGFSPNSITNYGVIGSNDTSANGYALFTENGTTIVDNYGKLNGNNSVQGSIVNHVGATINSGQILDLAGGTLTNDGTLNAGGDGKLTTTSINGDYIQTGSGRLSVNADLIGAQTDLITVSGKAIVAGSVEMRPGHITNRAVTVLTAAGGLTIDPTLASVDSVALYDFTPQASTDGRSLVIQPEAKFTQVASSLGAGRQAVAANLQSIFDSGARLDAGFDALAGVKSTADFDRSLAAISGQALGAVGSFRFNTSRAFIGNLYGGCERHGADEQEGRCAWTRAFHTETTQDESIDKLGYRARATGFQIGGQTQLSDNWYLSGAVAYQNSHFRDDDHSARIKGDGVLGGLSLRYARNRLEVSGALDAGYGWYRSRRAVAVGTLVDQARAKPNLWEVGAHANIAYTIDLGSRAYARPYADLHLIHVDSKRYTETGPSPFNLAVDAESKTAVSGGIGVEVGGRLALNGGGTLRPFASVGIELASNAGWTTTARFAGQADGDTFDVRTGSPSTFGRFAMGVELLGAKNVDLSLTYAPEIGKGYVSHAGLAKLTYRF